MFNKLIALLVGLFLLTPFIAFSDDGGPGWDDTLVWYDDGDSDYEWDDLARIKPSSSFSVGDLLVARYVIGSASVAGTNATTFSLSPFYTGDAEKLTVQTYYEASASGIVSASNASTNPITFEVQGTPFDLSISNATDALFTKLPEPIGQLATTITESLAAPAFIVPVTSRSDGDINPTVILDYLTAATSIQSGSYSDLTMTTAGTIMYVTRPVINQTVTPAVTTNYIPAQHKNPFTDVGMHIFDLYGMPYVSVKVTGDTSTGDINAGTYTILLSKIRR